MNLHELKSRTLEELSAQAKSLKLSVESEMDCSRLLLAILRSHSESGGTISGRGTLEILSDGFGFLRNSKSDYTPTPEDIYVSPSQIRRFRLSTGDTIVGQVRPPRESERYFALLRVESVNELSTDNTRAPSTSPARAVHPSEKLSLSETNLCARLWQLLCPTAKGQRVLVLAPPRSHSNRVLLEIAQAAESTSLLTLLIAQRPEVISECQDAGVGAIVSTTFDEAAARHTQMAEMVFENARRKADRGEDVVVLVDSLTRLTQAASQNSPSSPANLPAGLNFKGIQHTKRLFATGRNIEDAGSITLIALLRDAGEPVDEYLRQELSSAANVVVRLSAEAAKQGCALPLAEPTSNVDESRFLNQEEQSLLDKIRSSHTLGSITALKDLEEELAQSPNNHEFANRYQQ